ncbi:Rsec15 protein [Mycena chlorophos]|uniref:Exocyst complex component SEC15 n=1 Tax=Mycena chlorophos TaxID=658473 RepID=A0A8H6S4B8_MYCCL|nr:Rsec15 protein [Mycena chlorophos]
MPPRRRPQFTQEAIDQQLQQIHLLDPSSSSENLEQLGPIIKQIHTNRGQDAFLRTVQGLIESKDADIEKICGENYQDFISSVSTLFTVKQYTEKMKDNIRTLDSSVAQLGRGLVEKKRNLLQSKKTASNLDEAIDTLQACLRVLDVVNRVQDMVKQGKYWSALRSLEDIESMPTSSLSQTPFFQYLLATLPSLRGQIKDAVNSSMKQWLLEIRNISGDVGGVALDQMESRTRKWRSRRDKDPLLRTSRVGSAVEMVTYEKNEFDVLNNEQIRVDFRPLFECIHIYTTLDSLDELQKSYQADRKAQSDLILPNPLPLSSLPSLIQEISGFFIIETHVLQTTGNFRSERDVEELWDGLLALLTMGIENALRTETDPDSFLSVKESLLSFIVTLESSNYSTLSLHSFIIVLFEKYARLLETQFNKRFDNIVQNDDHLQMQVETANQMKTVLDVVWIEASERRALEEHSICVAKTFVPSYKKFYAFVEGVSQHHRNIDELLSKSLDSLLINHISKTISQRLTSLSTLTQIAQIVTNLEYLQVTCVELQRSLTSLRSSQRGGSIVLTASSSFEATLARALQRITGLISSKLDDFFGLSEYNWTPAVCEDGPAMYLYELVNWLTTVVDALVIKEAYKDEAYKGAVAYIADCLMDFLTGRNIPMMNENAVSNILVDVDFLEEELRRIGRGTSLFHVYRIANGTQKNLLDWIDLLLVLTMDNITDQIPSKLDAFFELSEYDWTPTECEDGPSMYIYELINWLMTVIDAQAVEEASKEEVYKVAFTISMMNENAVSNILIDVDFLEQELRRIGRGHLCSIFVELRATDLQSCSTTPEDFLVPADRQTSFAAVKPEKLQALLDKLAKHAAGRELGDRRKREADAVGRLLLWRTREVSGPQA